MNPKENEVRKDERTQESHRPRPSLGYLHMWTHVPPEHVHIPTSTYICVSIGGGARPHIYHGGWAEVI